MFKNNQNGTTMMEAIAAISIVSVLTVGAFKLIGGMFESFKQNMVENEIQEVQKAIVSRYRLEGDYSKLSEINDPKDFRDQQLVPAQMYSSSGLRHRQNGEVEISVPTDLGPDYFEVKFSELSNRSCVNLSQINWNSGQNSDLYRLKINGTTFVLPVRGNSGNFLPVSMAAATEACKKNTEDKVDKNEITWTFQ